MERGETSPNNTADDSDDQQTVGHTQSKVKLDPAEEARRAAAKEEKRKQVEAEKKNKRKAKKEEKEEISGLKGGVKAQSRTGNQFIEGKDKATKESVKGSESKAYKGGIIEEGTGDIDAVSLIQAKLDQAEAKRVELQHKDGKGALFRVDEEIVYVSNSDIERLEQVRKEREQNAKEREVEKAKADALKAKQQADLQKLQENLALKHKKGRR